jgi:hypothetical protein
MTAEGGRVVSIDPLYEFDGGQIRRRFDETIDEVLSQVRATPERWVWSYHKDIDDLRRNRERAIQLFAADYEAGLREERYRLGFLYSDLFDEEFHVASITELCRTAREVRIFPLLTLKQERSPHLHAVQQTAKELGFDCVVENVSYELQKGGNEMLRLTRRT